MIGSPPEVVRMLERVDALPDSVVITLIGAALLLVAKLTSPKRTARTLPPTLSIKSEPAPDEKKEAA